MYGPAGQRGDVGTTFPIDALVYEVAANLLAVGQRETGDRLPSASCSSTKAVPIAPVSMLSRRRAPWKTSGRSRSQPPLMIDVCRYEPVEPLPDEPTPPSCGAESSYSCRSTTESAVGRWSCSIGRDSCRGVRARPHHGVPAVPFIGKAHRNIGLAAGRSSERHRG